MDKSKTAQDSAEASNEKTLKAKSKSASERKSILIFVNTPNRSGWQGWGIFACRRRRQ